MENSLNILVVDDIFTNRLLLKETVKKLVKNYYEAVNGKEAVDILRKNDIDIILMDIEMPVMNGLEATEFIRHRLPFPKSNTPIIALTAHNPNMFFEEFEDTGFNALLTKPYSVDKIKQKIFELLKK